MKTNEILTRLEYGTCGFDSEAVGEAIRRPAEITPLMLQILEDIVVNELPLPEHYTAHRYAIYILAVLGGTDAHIPLLQVCLLPERRLNALFGGNVLDSELDLALADTSGGDISGITLLIEDEDACEDARIVGLRALVHLADSGDVSREDIAGTLDDLFESMEHMPMLLWEELVFCAALLATAAPGPVVLPAREDDESEDYAESEDYVESERDDSEDGWWNPEFASLQ